MRAAHLLAAVVLTFFLSAASTIISPETRTAERAHKLHFSSIVLDTHDDTMQRFFSKTFDLGKHNPEGKRGHSTHAPRRHERDFLFHLD
jgi:hypothetical protein